MTSETGKNGPYGPIMAVFRRIPMSFKLSSVSHTAYRMFQDVPVCGDRQFVVVFDPAETSDG
jgi:hypothetical protein